MYGNPGPGASPSAAVAPAEVLAGKIRRIAEVGRLRVGEDPAAYLVHAAAGCGATLTLIALPEDRRDPAPSDTARDAVIAAITTDAPVPAAPGSVAGAIAPRAVLPQTSALTTRERVLLQKWLDRIAR